MTAYSYWEQGRSLGTGQIVSMTPFNPNSGGQLLGGMPLGGAGMALSAIAQFGIYLEARQMRLIKEAEFEERRNSWVLEIGNQWIAEHRNTVGIRRDITNRMAMECSKLLTSVMSSGRVDVPQVVLLQTARIAEYLEWNFKLAASAVNKITEHSGSDERWKMGADVDFGALAESELRERSAETRVKKGTWWSGPLKVLGGLPLALFTGPGAFVGGGAIGYGVVEVFEYIRTKHVDFELLEDKIPLLQFCLAAEALEQASQSLNHLLEQQRFEVPARLTCREVEADQIEFLLQSIKKPGWFYKPKLDLNPVSYPDSTR